MSHTSSNLLYFQKQLYVANNVLVEALGVAAFRSKMIEVYGVTFSINFYFSQNISLFNSPKGKFHIQLGFDY